MKNNHQIGYLALAIDDSGNIKILGIHENKNTLESVIKNETKYTNYKIFSMDDNIAVLIQLWLEMNGISKNEALYLIAEIRKKVYEAAY